MALLQIRIRRDTAANWTTNNPVLEDSEPGRETDTGKIKYGDGTTHWNDLAYSGGGSAGAASHVFMQDADPAPATGFGEYIWFKMDGSGNLLDIIAGEA